MQTTITVGKVSNKKKTIIVTYCLFCILAIDLLCLLFINKMQQASGTLLCVSLLLIFGLILWRIVYTKAFSIEVSEYLISIKYGHPFSKALNFPVLEVPFEKVASYRIERGFVDHYLIVNIQSKRGKKSFYFRVGILYGKQTERLKKVLNRVTLPKANDTGL